MAGLAAGGAEAVAPAVANWLYGSNPDVKKDADGNVIASELTADQKNTLSNIIGLGTAGVTGLAGGSVTDVVNSTGLAQTAVEDNFLDIYTFLPNSVKQAILDKIGEKFSVGVGGKAAMGEGGEAQLTMDAKGNVTATTGLTHGAAIELGPITSWQLVGQSPDGVYTRFTAKTGVGVTITKSATGWSLSLDASPGAEISVGTGFIKQLPK